MHAKLSIADRRVLLVTAKNIEAGLLIRGGTAPTRAAEHIEARQANGTLAWLV